MPSPPGDIVDINILTGYWDNRCESTWTVYIETTYMASKNLILSLLAFGLDDVIRGYFRPVAQRKWRHGRKGRKARRVKFRIPETGEIVAKMIPGQEAVAGRWVDGGTKWLWQVDTVLQKYLYIVMIHELINDFWMDFQTGIITSPDSDCGNLARTYMRGSGGEPISLGWVAKSMHTTVYQERITNTPFSSLVGPGQFITILHATVENNDSHGATVEVQIRVREDGAPAEQIEYSSLESLGPGGRTTLIATLKWHGPGTVVWEVRKEGGECFFLEWSQNTFQVGDPIV